jgi:hypothetical protein
VVGVVPFVSPEKNASAISQKKGLPIASVNGSVVTAPPQLPLSARSRADAIMTISISATTINARELERELIFILSPVIGPVIPTLLRTKERKGRIEVRTALAEQS